MCIAHRPFYVQVRAACVDFGCRRPSPPLPLRNSSLWVIGPRVHAHMWRCSAAAIISHVDTRPRSRVVFFLLPQMCFSWRKEMSDVSRMARTRRRLPHRGLGMSAGPISRKKKLPSPVCQGSAKSGSRFRFTRLKLQTLSPALAKCVLSCCTFSFPSPPAEPPVPGMFRPSRRCLQDAAHPEQCKFF